MKKSYCVILIVLLALLFSCSMQNEQVETEMQGQESEFIETKASASSYSWWSEKASIPSGHQIITFGYKRNTQENITRDNVFCPYVLTFVPDNRSSHSGMYYWKYYHMTDDYWFTYFDLYVGPGEIYPIQSTACGLFNLMNSGEIYRWGSINGNWTWVKYDQFPANIKYIKSAPRSGVRHFYVNNINEVWRNTIVEEVYFDLDGLIYGNLRDMAVGYYTGESSYPDNLAIITNRRRLYLTYRDASGDHWERFYFRYLELRQIAMRSAVSGSRFDGLHMITNTRIYKYQGNREWMRLSSLPSGYPKHLTVDENGYPWIINSYGQVYVMDPY